MTDCRCGKPAEKGRTECFRCRVSTVGFGLQGGAIEGSAGFHTSKKDWMRENLGTTDDRELGRKGIERAS